ncbi:Uncharacterised protein [Bordetella pertussis]|nr:Uncharacterised protein [Bordetella pertussis]
MMKQHTASISSGEQVVSTHTVNAAVDAAAGWGAGSGSGSGSGAATGAGAAAAGACPPSSASWRNTAQMRSNTASSGSSEAR